ncbi:cache domain-containing protein [bacterium]|nr:cache domain-containing protein [bacterium]
MKNLDNEKYILNIIKYSPIFLVLIISIITTQLFIYERNHSFNNDLKQIEETFYKENEDKVKEEVLKVYAFIKEKKEKSEENLKNEIRNRVYEAHQMATNIYEKESTIDENGIKHSKEHIFETIKSALGGIIYNNGRGYFFIDDENGTKLLQPLNEKLEGVNLSNYKDANGYQFVKKIITTIENKNEAFDSYYWYKAKDSSSPDQKISFYKYFEPFNVVIGTGEYVKDFEDELKSELLEKIRNIRFGDDGYIFMFDLEGNILSHYEKELIGKNGINEKNEEGRYLIKEIIEFAKEKDDRFINYISTVNPNKLVKNKDKVSYVKIFPEWNWLIGSGFYIKNLNDDIEKRKALLKESNEKAINNIIYLSLLITTIFVFISFYVSKIVKDKFKNYKIEIEKEIKNTLEKEKLLIQQSKMATMGEMIGNIAHQWKQPLSVISLSNGIIKLNREFKSFSEEEIEDAIKGIDDSVKNLSSTIDDFRNFFNPNKKEESFDIKDAFDKTFKLIDSQFKYNDIKIIKNIQSVIIDTYENELLQTLINILKNAKDELIKKDVNEKKFIFIDAIKEDKKLIIRIKDNANGIPEDIIDNIFGAYFTTKEETGGTGIGLYMSKNIIEHMGGTLSVSNVEYIHDGIKYKGAQFQIVLILC